MADNLLFASRSYIGRFVYQRVFAVADHAPAGQATAGVLQQREPLFAAFLRRAPAISHYGRVAGRMSTLDSDCSIAVPALLGLLIVLLNPWRRELVGRCAAS